MPNARLMRPAAGSRLLTGTGRPSTIAIHGDSSAGGSISGVLTGSGGVVDAPCIESESGGVRRSGRQTPPCVWESLETYVAPGCGADGHSDKRQACGLDPTWAPQRLHGCEEENRNRAHSQRGKQSAPICCSRAHAALRGSGRKPAAEEPLVPGALRHPRGEPQRV